MNAELILHVWCEWECEECGRRQEMVEDEEWQICCGKTMKMQPYRKFTARKVESVDSQEGKDKICKI